MDKRFWAIIIVIIIAFGGIVLFKGNGKTGSSNGASPTNHIEGQGKKVTLVEYGDYECPSCAGFEPIVEQVMQRYSQNITFQFRNLPLSQIHQNAFAAARAAEAASKQNKFWEMHNLLYQNQNEWNQASNADTIFKKYAAQLGLNAAQFQQDVSSSAVNDAINADIDAFNKTGQEMATPSFFLDGKFVRPTPNVDAFAKLIDAELAKNK